MLATYSFRSKNEQDTERLGRALAEALPFGVVALDGPLGAGKTRLVQAVAAACGVDRREVVSPTFVLMHEYQGTRPIYHLDAYRLRDDDEFLQLGADEHFGPPNLVFIEWAGRIERCMPRERLEIAISVLFDQEREFNFVAHGPLPVAALEILRDKLKAAPGHD
jgi:tRNA threonylcarbamoyladenosine biosynthesis protein TsaE